MGVFSRAGLATLSNRALAAIARLGNRTVPLPTDDRALALAGIGLGGGDSIRPSPAHVFGSDDLSVYVAGVMYCESQRLTASDVAIRYRDRGLDGLFDGSGEFVLCLVDWRVRRLVILPGPLGTVPVCYSQGERGFAFGPSAASVLGLLGQPLAMSRDSALQFLSDRYLLGPQTMFSGVNRLMPGQYLSCDLDSGVVTVATFWDLDYEHAVSSRDDAVAQLHLALQASHERMFDELGGQGSYGIFLTGGMDSRGILGYAQAAGRLPARAMTWGERDAVPGSDPAIARALAQQLGIQFRFIPVDGNAWPAHAPDWALQGELQADNANCFITPLDLFQRHCARYRFAVIGDELFGAGPLPADAREAVDNVMRTAICPQSGPVAMVLRPDSHREAQTDRQRRLQEIVEGGASGHPKDIQDRMFFHTYIASWILAPGNFKMPLLNVRRPLMTREVIDVVRRWSPALRVDKTVYVDLLKRHFPGLLRQPTTSVDALVDWGRRLRQPGPLRAWFESSLRAGALESLPIAADLDLDATSAWLAHFFAQVPDRDERPGPWHRRLYGLRRHLHRSPALGRLARTVQPWVLKLAGYQAAEKRSLEHQLVMRLALLLQLQQRIDDSGAVGPIENGRLASAAPPTSL